MAVHYYNLKVIMCRERGDANAVGSITHSDNTRDEWEYEFTSTDVTGSVAKSQFLAAMETALDDAPEHIKLLTRSGGVNVPGSLRTALSTSATPTNDGVATSGPWSERVGKDVFRYEIGVSTTSRNDAESKRTAHNLS